ncbi:MAG: HAD-IB family hydrolase [Gammaproteobacteria bacterium]
MALAIFDIDGTLVTGPSTELRLFALLLRHGWLKPRQLLAFLRFGLAFAPEFGRQTMKKNKAYLAGLRCAEVEALASDWVWRSAPGWWFPPGLARLRQHQAAGDRVVLLSGTPQFVAEVLARELGATRAVGTRCSTKGGQFLSGPPLRHPFGQEKLHLARLLCAEFRTPASDVFAYADSVNDLPVLRFSGHPVAIRPDAGLRAVAEAEGWEILGRR